MSRTYCILDSSSIILLYNAFMFNWSVLSTGHPLWHHMETSCSDSLSSQWLFNRLSHTSNYPMWLVHSRVKLYDAIWDSPINRASTPTSWHADSWSSLLPPSHNVNCSTHVFCTISQYNGYPLPSLGWCSKQFIDALLKFAATADFRPTQIVAPVALNTRMGMTPLRTLLLFTAFATIENHSFRLVFIIYEA